MRTLIIGSLLIIWANWGMSQKGPWSLGVQLAYQNTWILNNSDSEAGGQLDFGITFRPAMGLELAYAFDVHVSVQSGIIYSFQGQRYETAFNEDADYKTNLNYLKIPLLINYQSKPMARVGLVLQGGFQYSLLSIAKSSRENVFGYYDPALIDVSSYYENASIDLVLAVGAQYNFGQHALRLMIRGDYGLNDIEVTEKKPGFRDVSTNATIALPAVSYHHYF